MSYKTTRDLSPKALEALERIRGAMSAARVKQEAKLRFYTDGKEDVGDSFGVFSTRFLS